MAEIMEKAAIDFKLDRSSWEPVKFGDVAIQQKQSVDRENTSITRYVKGEHMGSEDFHLREWGELEDEYLGPAFIRRFEEGDILYGSRRTYLKKVVVAPFEGITSNTTFVIKPHEDRLDKRLLPFIMLSKGFTDHSVRNSKGSVNPYINWKDIANYEFLLPQKDQQSKLAELLWAMDAVVENELTLWEDLDSYSKNLEMKKFTQLWQDVKNGKIKAPKLEELITTPVCNGVFKKREEFGSGTLLINVTDVYKSFRVRPDTLDRVDLHSKEKESFSALPGDVIFNRSSLVKEGVGHTCLVPENKEEMVFECHLMRTRPNPKTLNSAYLNRYCLSPFGRNYLMSRSQTTTMTTLNQTGLNKMPIPLPDIIEQCDFSDMIDRIDELKESTISKVESSQSLQKLLINQVFS